MMPLKQIKCFVLILITTLMLCSGASFAQSFNCGKAESEAEKLICGNDELKRLDLELAKLYKEILSDPNKNKTRIRYWQRDWLKWRNIIFRSEAAVADIYKSRIIELSLWLRETSQNAAPINAKSKWGKDEKQLLITMYEIYKKDGFDRFYRYGADRESCTELLMDFMKLNFEPVAPTLKTNNPLESALTDIMGACGNIDPKILCVERTGCFTFSSYKLYKGNFDGDNKNGEELLLIAETPNADNISREYIYSLEERCGNCAEPTINGVGAALLLNTADNCSREINRDWRAFFFKAGVTPQIASSLKQYFVHALWYTKLPGETLHYGVARYKGRDYAYELHTKGNKFDLGLMDTGRYVCAGTINVID
jgi:uncharacterized protein YecT (DUF1311 family)